MVPGEQNSLEQDRKYADERAGSAPPLPSATEPNHYGEDPHLDPVSPACIRRTCDQNASQQRYIITLLGTCEPPFR